MSIVNWVMKPATDYKDFSLDGVPARAVNSSLRNEDLRAWVPQNLNANNPGASKVQAGKPKT